jgi:subtilisin family serine protease
MGFDTKAFARFTGLVMMGVLALAALIGGALQAQAGVPASIPAQQDVTGKIDSQVLKDTANGQSTSFVIMLADQADLSAAYSMKDQDARGWYVYNTLRDHAANTQGPIKSVLTAAGASFTSYWAANMIIATGDSSLVHSLAARSDVKSIDSNKPTKWIDMDPGVDTSSLVPDAPEWGVQNVNAPAVWALGFTGQGIVVGNQDTGMRWTHNALKPKYRGWNGATADHNYNWWDAIHSGGGACGPNTVAPCDDSGHGTHTTGTTVGEDGANQVGVAPGAKWIGCRNMNVGVGTPATYSECFQFFIAPTDLSGGNPNPSLRPHVMNNSWTCPASEGCTTRGELETIVNNTQAAGIFVEGSAGNAGPGCSTVADPPAIYAATFSTGAIDINNTLAGFSSRGPSTYYTPNLMKPNVSAPGVNVRSASSGSDTGYVNLSGTSMAGPHVVGVVALLWSARPALVRDITTTKTLLEQTANPNVNVTPVQTCGGIPSSQIPNNSFGYGRVDALAAYNASGPTQGTPTVTRTGTVVVPTNTAPPASSPTATPTVCGVQSISGSIDNSDPSHDDYVDLQDPAPSECATQRTCAGTVTQVGPWHYDVYTFTNTLATAQCVTVDLDASGCGTNGVWALAYLNSFDPTNLCSNYLGDAGSDPIAGPTSFSFMVPGNATFVLEVEEFTHKTGCASYTASVSGLGGSCATPTAPAATATRTVGATSTTPPGVTETAPAASATATSLTPQPTSTSCPIQFSDVPVGSTFYEFIRCLACRGIINGYPDGTFRPNNNATRGQISKIVSNSAGFGDPATQMFEDVPAGSTFFDFIGRLASRGYISGYPCGGPGEPCNPPGNLPYFRPNANATRGQVAKIVSNAAGFIEPVTGQTFEDVAPGSTFYEFVERLASRAVMSGYPCGSVAGEPCIPPENRPYFRPNRNVTRGQLSKIVANTFFPNCVTPSR